MNITVIGKINKEKAWGASSSTGNNPKVREMMGRVVDALKQTQQRQVDGEDHSKVQVRM